MIPSSAFDTQQRALSYAEPAGISTAQQDPAKWVCGASVAHSWYVALCLSMVTARIHDGLRAGNVLLLPRAAS